MCEKIFSNTNGKRVEEIVKKIISLFLILLAIIGVATTPLSGYPTAKAENEAATTEETAEATTEETTGSADGNKDK